MARKVILKHKPLYMAINEYGHRFTNLTSPRSGLLKALCVKHCRPIYLDVIEGDEEVTCMVGYYAGGCNWAIYEINPWMKEVSRRKRR